MGQQVTYFLLKPMIVHCVDSTQNWYSWGIFLDHKKEKRAQLNSPQEKSPQEKATQIYPVASFVPCEALIHPILEFLEKSPRLPQNTLYFTLE